MSDTVATWLADLPPDALRERIQQVEGELQLLRGLVDLCPSPRKRRAQKPGARKHSPQATAILDAIREQPGIGPTAVRCALRERGMDLTENNVQTHMSRLVARGVLQREGHGRYVLQRPPSG
jgi:Penicillinase repressor